MMRVTFVILIAMVLLLAGCGGKDAQPAGDGAVTAQAPAATPGSPITPAPGNKVIAIQMETEEDGSNTFEPANIEARRGDVIRYTLVTGVHNADFLPDSNPGKSGLPPVSPLLQLPGQTYDVKVELPPGTYYFHCDPHFLLGMKGTLTVVP